jgi:hypothetical protein
MTRRNIDSSREVLTTSPGARQGHVRLRLRRRYCATDVGRAGLEPATNGLSAPTRRFGNQAKQLACSRHIACKIANLSAAGTVEVRLRYGYKSPPVAGVS